MSKKKIAIAALAFIAIVAVGGGTYAVSAFTDHSLAAPAANQATVGIAETTAAATTATSATDPQQTQELRAQILDMLKNHMGLTGSEAEKLADAVTQQMEKNGATDAAGMVKQCVESGRTMNGNHMSGTDMMNGSAATGGIHESHHQSEGTTTVQ